MEWTDERIRQLRALRAEGMGTTEIAHLWGVGRGVITGKCDRLGIPPTGGRAIGQHDRSQAVALRPEKEAAFAKAWEDGVLSRELARRFRIGESTVRRTAARLGLTPRESAVVPRSEDGPPPAPKHIHQPKHTLPPLASQAAPAVAPALRTLDVPAARKRRSPAPTGRVIECCWPLGEPGTKGFRMCDKPSVPGRVYCAVHVEKAYVKVRERDLSAPDPLQTLGKFSFRNTP